MDAKEKKATRQRLTVEYKNLLQSISRKRVAADEIKTENTEDEGDLATISHDKALLYNLREGVFALLKSIQEAMKALDNDQYGECTSCGSDINEKRLLAVPWATLCIRCQEKTEAEHNSAPMVVAGFEEHTDL